MAPTAKQVSSKAPVPLSLAVALAALVLGLLWISLVPASAAAAKRSDLVVRKVSVAQRAVAPGGKVTLTDVTRNVGSRKAGRSTTGYLLSRDRKPGGNDIALGARRLKRLRPDHSSKKRTTTFIPASTGIGRAYLLACADRELRVRESREKNNCAPARFEVAKSSANLIADAERNGEIDGETALTYQVFAEFGDRRLPSRFEGAPVGGGDSDALVRALDHWSELSASTRETLDPFLIPPFDEGSWAQPASAGSRLASRAGARSSDGPAEDLCGQTRPNYRGWSYVEDLGGHFRVWFEKGRKNDEDQAQHAAAALNEEIWRKVTRLFGPPESDDGAARKCRGGSDALDFAVGSLPDASGLTIPYPRPDDPCADPVPTFIVLNRGLSGKLLKGTVAHELAHATHFAHIGNRCDESWYWLTEATAEWTEDYVYKGKLQTEHVEALDYLLDPEIPLDTFVPIGKGDPRQYGAYLFFFFLARSENDPKLIAHIWDAMEYQSGGALPAIQGVLAGSTIFGGIPGAWKEFARYNLNQKPVDDYRRWDQLPYNARSKGGSDLPAPAVEEIPIAVPRLAATYRSFDFQKDVKEIKFTNPLAGIKNASVQALIQRGEGRDATYRTADWSDQSSVTICRDKKHDPSAEDVTGVTIVFANGNYQKGSGVLNPSPAPKIETRERCEDIPERWTGTASGTVTGDGEQETWNATVTLERYYEDGHGALYQLANAHVTWSYSGPDCHASKTYDVGRVPGKGMSIYEFDDPDLPDEYDLDLPLAGPLVHFDCTNEEDDHDDFAFGWDITGSKPWTSGSTELSGQDTHASRWNSDYQVHWQWDLSAD